MYPTLHALEALFSYGANILLVICFGIFFAHTRKRGFMLLLAGSSLNLLLRAAQAVMPPIVLSPLAYSNALSPVNSSQYTLAVALSVAHLLASALTGVGAFVAVRTWSNNSSKPTPLRGAA